MSVLQVKKSRGWDWERIVLQQGCVSETKVGCIVEQEFLAGGTGTKLPGEHILGICNLNVNVLLVIAGILCPTLHLGLPL